MSLLNARSLLRGLYFVMMLAVPLLVLAQDATPAVTIHVVQRGETLSRIAAQYGTSVQRLAALNGIANPENITVGQRLLVPPAGADVSAPAQTHTVKPGETLQGIANLYGVSIGEIARQNNIGAGYMIYVGQVLQIGGESITPAPTSAPSQPVVPTIAPATAAPTVSAAPTQVRTHIIQPGETMFRIAQRYGLTVAQLAAANNLTDVTTIYAGQRLIIPEDQALSLSAPEFPAPILDVDVTPTTLTEGQTGRFRVRTSTPATLTGTFLNRGLVAGSENDGMTSTILVGVPVGTEAGVYPLRLTVNGAVSIDLNIQVAGGRFYREAITIPASRSDLLNANMDQEEINILRGVMSAFNPIRFFDGTFGLPAAAPITSPFGSVRNYNGGVFQGRHIGTDFAAGIGAPVLAVAPGRVVLADTLNVRGMMTVIDHGWGVYSSYSHQSERYVNLGDMVRTGQVIGAVGNTGRSIGAHLHWEVWVGGVPVNPMQWTRTNFD